MTMKLDATFWHDEKNNTNNFEYSTHINGVTYRVRECIPCYRHRVAGLSLEALWEGMRRKLLQHIGKELFKGL